MLTCRSAAPLGGRGSLLLLLATLTGLGAIDYACTPAARRTVLRGAVDLGDDACVELRAIEGRDVQEFCAKLDELRPFADKILAARRAAAARDAGGE